MEGGGCCWGGKFAWHGAYRCPSSMAIAIEQGGRCVAQLPPLLLLLLLLPLLQLQLLLHPLLLVIIVFINPLCHGIAALRPTFICITRAPTVSSSAGKG